MSSINIQIGGICCFVDALNNSYPYRKRLVVPYDPSTAADRHIPFVEIAQYDIDSYIGAGPSATYIHEVGGIGSGNVMYSRWDLAGHRISINAAASPALTTTDAFTKRVPQMKKVLPDLRFYPDMDCFADNPSPTLVAGLLDIAAGTLDVGPLDEITTDFDPQRNWPPVNRAPQYTVLQAPLAAGAIKVEITAFTTSTGRDTEITLKAGTAWIRIGNEQELDITGPGSGENPSAYFLLYYNLSDRDTYDKLPRPLPVPKVSAVPINACSNTNWP